MEASKVVLLKGRGILAEGIHFVLENGTDDTIALVAVGQIDDDASQLILTHRPDVILLDIARDGELGLTQIRNVMQAEPNAKILAFSSDGVQAQSHELIEAGAWGFLDTPIETTAIVTAIEALTAGKMYYDGRIQDFSRASTDLDGTNNGDTPRFLYDQLTPREKEVFALLAAGHRNRDIAEHLYISVRTVENHRAHIMEKLKLHSVVDLVRLAREVSVL